MDQPQLPPAQARDREVDNPDGGWKKAFFTSLTAALGALAVAIPSLQKSCETSDKVDVANVRANVAAEDADAARQVVNATAEKADATGETVSKVTAEYVTRKELEDALSQLGKQGRAVELEPQPIPVPEVVSQEIPVVAKPAAKVK